MPSIGKFRPDLGRHTLPNHYIRFFFFACPKKMVYGYCYDQYLLVEMFCQNVSCPSQQTVFSLGKVNLVFATVRS
ncbi:unnamed protein product [Ixodes persulcatus]